MAVANVQGRGLVYQCGYSTEKLQVVLVAMALKDPTNVDGKTMTIQCSDSNPLGVYVYRAQIGYPSSSREKVLTFQNSKRGTSCVVVSAKTVMQLVSLQSSTNPTPPQILIQQN